MESKLSNSAEGGVQESTYIGFLKDKLKIDEKLFSVKTHNSKENQKNVADEYVKNIMKNIDTEIEDYSTGEFILMPKAYYRILFFHPDTLESYIEVVVKLKLIDSDNYTVKYYLTKSCGIKYEDIEDFNDEKIDKTNLTQVDSEYIVEILTYLCMKGMIFESYSFTERC